MFRLNDVVYIKETAFGHDRRCLLEIDKKWEDEIKQHKRDLARGNANMNKTIQKSIKYKVDISLHDKRK